MKRVVKLTEQDLYRIVKRVIKEQEATQTPTQPTPQAATTTQTPNQSTTQQQIQLGGGFRNNTMYRFSKIVSESSNLEYKGQVYQLNKTLSDVVTMMSKVQPNVGQNQDIWGVSEVKSNSFCETLLMKDRGIYIKDNQGRSTNYVFKCGDVKGKDPMFIVFYKEPGKSYSSQGL